MFFSSFSYSSFYSSVRPVSFSKPASEVKPGRAGLVRGWVTVREYAVSWGPFSFAWLQASWWFQQGMCDVFLTSSEGIWLRREPNRVFASGYSASPSQIKAATHVWHSVFPTNRFWQWHDFWWPRFDLIFTFRYFVISVFKHAPK